MAAKVFLPLCLRHGEDGQRSKAALVQNMAVTSPLAIVGESSGCT